LKNRGFLTLAISAIGLVVAPSALAAFKCTTKNGVTYQDKPCQEVLPTDTQTLTGKDAARELQRQPQRVVKQEMEKPQERPKSAVEQRKADVAADHGEWLGRAAKKAESLKRCASGEVQCTATSVREAAMYLSERQLEEVLGAPMDKQLVGLESTSKWTVRVRAEGGLHSARLVAAWGLCSDDKNYFASGQGQRACKINVE